MNNPVHHDFIFILDLEQNAVHSDAQAVLRAEIGQPLHITGEVIRQSLKGVGNPRCVLLLQTPQVFRRSGLQSNCVLRVIILPEECVVCNLKNNVGLMMRI